MHDLLSVAGHEKPLEEEVLAAETCFANQFHLRFIVDVYLCHDKPKHWMKSRLGSTSHPF